MELAFGTETLPDYYAFELGRAARVLVEEVLPIQVGQNAVITADTASDGRVVKATAQAVYAAGAVPTVVWYPTQAAPCQEPPAPVACALRAAQVWIEFATAYILYSKAYQSAIEAGSRYLCLPGMDADMMVRTIGRVPYAPLSEMATVLYELSQAAEVIHVTSPAGTDLTVHIDKEGDPFWEPPPPDKGFPQMLGGQSGFAAQLPSFEGKLVFDGALWPPAELGLLRAPVALHLEKGVIQRIEGGHQALVFERWLDSFNEAAMYMMDHACYGFNPGVPRPTGRILEDERVFGCMQFGIGPARLGAPSHTDGVVLNPSVWADDLLLEDQGRYVHPDLVRLCRAMQAPGY